MERELAERCWMLAAQQHGLITRAQATKLGALARAVDRLVTTGVWVPRYPGVYELRGAPRSWQQDLMAACLWVENGVVSDIAVAALWQLDGFRPGPLVLIGTTKRRWPDSARVAYRRVAGIPKRDRRAVGGIPVLSITATLIDLARELSPARLEEVLDRALRARRTTPEELWARLQSESPGAQTDRPHSRARPGAAAPLRGARQPLSASSRRRGLGGEERATFRCWTERAS